MKSESLLLIEDCLTNLIVLNKPRGNIDLEGNLGIYPIKQGNVHSTEDW